MRVRRIDMFIMRSYGDYCDESLRYNDLQKSFKQWKNDNIKDLVKEYIKMRRLVRW